MRVASAEWTEKQHGRAEKRSSNSAANSRPLSGSSRLGGTPMLATKPSAALPAPSTMGSSWLNASEPIVDLGAERLPQVLDQARPVRTT